MPEPTQAASEEAAREPKVRRISNKNPRKSAKAPKPEPESEVEVEVEVPSEEFDSSPPSNPDESATLPEIPGDSKRKNRRRRGKGKSKDGEPEETAAESKPEETPEPRDRQPQRIQQTPKPRRKPDPEKVAKNAWKIFLAEVSEEGVALIGDSDARELARRCFRLSEIFMEEEDRRG